MKSTIVVCVVLLQAGLLSSLTARAEKRACGTVTVARTDLSGIGLEKGVSRRDPSDIIRMGGLYYVWYSKGPLKTGYEATVWYATSPDGLKWTEKGQSVAKGDVGAWDAGSVFTPNILVADGHYWLFYTGTSKPYKKGFQPDSKIGIAVSDSPDGPWKRLPKNPVLKNSDNPDDFDSLLVDDACLMVLQGKFWFYYKGRQVGKSAHHTQMGLAIAERPEGPYVKYEANPVLPGNHAILAWPQGKGVAVMTGTTGPEGIRNSVQYAEDGIHFTKTHNVVDGPRAGGSYRPEAFTGSNAGGRIQWCVEVGKHVGKELPYIDRCDVEWPKLRENKDQK